MLPSTSCRAEIRISVKPGRAASSIRAALAPDLKHLPKDDGGGRAEISLQKSDDVIVFKIETSDLATLRASVNSYLLLAGASYRCLTL